MKVTLEKSYASIQRFFKDYQKMVSNRVIESQILPFNTLMKAGDIVATITARYRYCSSLFDLHPSNKGYIAQAQCILTENTEISHITRYLMIKDIDMPD